MFQVILDGSLSFTTGSQELAFRWAYEYANEGFDVELVTLQSRIFIGHKPF